MFMAATVYEIAGGSGRPSSPPLVSGVGSKRLGTGIGTGRVKETELCTFTSVINWLKLDVAWREMLTSCHKYTVYTV